MTPRERAIAALERKQPDDIVPTFELEFQLTPEFFNKGFKGYDKLSEKELDMAVGYNAEFYVEIAEKLDYSIIRTGDIKIMKKVVEMGANKKFLICWRSRWHNGNPDGKSMVDLSFRLFEHGDEIKKGLEGSVDNGINWGRSQIEAGASVLTMCADYCL